MMIYSGVILSYYNIFGGIIFSYVRRLSDIVTWEKMEYCSGVFV